MLNEAQQDATTTLSDLQRRIAELEEEVRASEARFQVFFQASPLGLFESTHDGFCTYISPEWAQLTGRPVSDLLGFGWRDTLHPDDVEAAADVWRVAHESGGPYQHEFRVVHGSGEIRWTRAVARRLKGSPTGEASYIGCIEDITDRKHAALAQQESEERFRAFMDNNPAVAFMKDSAGRRVYANATYMECFRVNNEEVLGKTDYDMFEPALARKLGQNDLRVLSEGLPIQTIEDIPTADGIMRHWLVYKFPVDAPSGDRYVGGVALDITERRRAEEALRQTRDELEKRVAERTNRLSVANARLQREILERETADAALRAEQVLMRRLLYRNEVDRKLVAYEIHDGPVQYVTAALLHLESVRPVLGELPPVAEEAFKTALGLLRNTIQESRRLISGLQPTMLDQSGVVAAIDCLIGDNFPPGMVSFAHEMRTERLTPLVEGALFRICQEALTNAMKHSQASKICVRLQQENAWVRLEVADEGIGFDPDEAPLEHNFGLRGIRERARLLGGHTTIDSAPGRGTRIAVELPITEL